jgi:hypothetical protein
MDHKDGAMENGEFNPKDSLFDNSDSRNGSWNFAI